MNGMIFPSTICERQVNAGPGLFRPRLIQAVDEVLENIRHGLRSCGRGVG